MRCCNIDLLGLFFLDIDSYRPQIIPPLSKYLIKSEIGSETLFA